MFDFIFRKKPTIFLLLAIIVISLIFSMLLNQPLHEGLDNAPPSTATPTEVDTSKTPSYSDATINNPPPELIDQAMKIIQDNDKERLAKLSAIRELLKNKYKILGDIYRQNESALLKELITTLSVPAKKDSEGKLFDENALDGYKRDNANKILSSSDFSAMEKIEKIKALAGKDRMLSNILDEYIQAWFRMVKDNFDKLKSTSNDIVNPIASP